MKRPKVSTKISQDSWLFERQGVVSLPSWRNDSPWSWQWSWRTWDSGCPSPVILMMVAKSCTTLDGWNPINHGLNHLSTGGSDFSTVSWGFLSIRDWAFVVWVYCGDPMDEQQRGHEFLLTFFFVNILGMKKNGMYDLYWSIRMLHQLFTKYLKDIFLGEYTENVSINDRDLTSH